MAWRRYTAALINGKGAEIRIRVKPFLILDLADDSPNLPASMRRLDGLLADLSQLDPGHGVVPTTYRLALYDGSGTLVGHWTAD